MRNERDYPHLVERWRAADSGAKNPPTPRFRTIQVRPKDRLTRRRQAKMRQPACATAVAGWYDRRRHSAEGGSPCRA